MSPLFRLLEHPEFKEGVCWRRQQVEANAVIFHEGEPGKEVYLIHSGRVRVVGNVDMDGLRQVHPGFSELSEGDVFGELVLFDDQPRSASVHCVMDSELIVIDGPELMSFLDRYPDIAYPIFKELIYILVGRLRQANKRIFSLFAWGLKARGFAGLV